MNQKRNVFLFGAGAVLDWTAPSTLKLTEIILQSGFKTNDNETTITKYIHETLLNSGYTSREVNFETIINVIEELIIYYSTSDSQFRLNSHTKLCSLHSIFFSSKVEDDIFNYEIEGMRNTHPFKLTILRQELSGNTTDAKALIKELFYFP